MVLGDARIAYYRFVLCCLRFVGYRLVCNGGSDVSAAIMIPTWKDGVLQPVEKLAAHQLGLRHKAVSVFVMAGTKVLIQQRALGKYHTPGKWRTPVARILNGASKMRFVQCDVWARNWESQGWFQIIAGRLNTARMWAVG